jgi:hypothetical protein
LKKFPSIGADLYPVLRGEKDKKNLQGMIDGALRKQPKSYQGGNDDKPERIKLSSKSHAQF